MAIYPTQTRCVDPYSDLFSQNVNKLSRIKTRGRSVIVKNGDLEVSINLSNPTRQLDVGIGDCIIDDMYISVEATTLDIISDVNLYSGGIPPAVDGTYYLALYYAYTKSRPAPKAGFVMLKPNQLSLISSDNYLFLAKINVIIGTTNLEISSIETYDTENSDAMRIFADVFAGIYPTTPTFDPLIHEGALLYVEDQNTLLLGRHTIFEQLNPTTGIVDTTLCQLGDLAYVDSTGRMAPAIATSTTTLANGLVTSVGTVADKDGVITITGKSQIRVDGSVTAGNKLYLSETVAGAATATLPSTRLQYVGTALSSGTDELVDVWFYPPIISSTAVLENNLNSLITYAGTSVGVSIPSYSSTEIITSGSNLTTAISDLDEVLGTVNAYKDNFQTSMEGSYKNTNYFNPFTIDGTPIKLYWCGKYMWIGTSSDLYRYNTTTGESTLVSAIPIGIGCITSDETSIYCSSNAGGLTIYKINKISLALENSTTISGETKIDELLYFSNKLYVITSNATSDNIRLRLLNPLNFHVDFNDIIYTEASTGMECVRAQINSYSNQNTKICGYLSLLISCSVRSILISLDLDQLIKNSSISTTTIFNSTTIDPLDFIAIDNLIYIFHTKGVSVYDTYSTRGFKFNISSMENLNSDYLTKGSATYDGRYIYYACLKTPTDSTSICIFDPFTKTSVFADTGPIAPRVCCFDGNNVYVAGSGTDGLVRIIPKKSGDYLQTEKLSTEISSKLDNMIMDGQYKYAKINSITTNYQIATATYGVPNLTYPSSDSNGKSVVINATFTSGGRGLIEVDIQEFTNMLMTSAENPIDLETSGRLYLPFKRHYYGVTTIVSCGVNDTHSFGLTSTGLILKTPLSNTSSATHTQTYAIPGFNTYDKIVVGRKYIYVITTEVSGSINIIILDLNLNQLLVYTPGINVSGNIKTAGIDPFGRLYIFHGQYINFFRGLDTPASINLQTTIDLGVIYNYTQAVLCESILYLWNNVAQAICPILLSTFEIGTRVDITPFLNFNPGTTYEIMCSLSDGTLILGGSGTPTIVCVKGSYGAATIYNVRDYDLINATGSIAAAFNTPLGLVAWTSTGYVQLIPNVVRHH